jgi:hypothetical protein
MTGSSPQFPAEEVAGSPCSPAGRSREVSPLLAQAKEHGRPRTTELRSLLDHSPWLSGYLAPDYHADRQGPAHLRNHLKPGRCHLAISGQPHWVTHTWSVSSLPFSEGLADQPRPARVRRARILKRLKGQVVDLAMQNVEHPRSRHVSKPGPGIHVPRRLLRQSTSGHHRRNPRGGPGSAQDAQRGVRICGGGGRSAGISRSSPRDSGAVRGPEMN